MKKCFKCLTKKPLAQFYPHKQMADGHLNKCKLCAKKDVRRRYYDPSSREQIVAYEQERAKLPARRAKVADYQRTRRARHPGKNRARQKINNLIRSGTLEKLPCQICGETKVEAHHTDYRKPLEVQWLCRTHHLEAEGKTPY